ncbi:MAG: dUTP diphosphatase [Clostridia bacterium]|nr:dUTP diphosphatase [Clostridia bacterium]
MKMLFQKLDPRAIQPAYASKSAAGADLYALLDEPLSIAPQETHFVRTGIAAAIPEGYVGLVCARSGLACKQDLAPANKVGVIDSDYRGEVMVALHNHGQETRTVRNGDRIAQMLIMPVLQAQWEETAFLEETERGNGGFGSTGR